MSSWNGFEDGDANDSTPLSSPSSPFSTAFRTPRPPGIETGVRGSTSHSQRTSSVQEGRRSLVAVQATVNQLAAYAIRMGLDVRSIAIGALASVLIRQHGRTTVLQRQDGNEMEE